MRQRPYLYALSIFSTLLPAFAHAEGTRRITPAEAPPVASFGEITDKNLQAFLNATANKVHIPVYKADMAASDVSWLAGSFTLTNLEGKKIKVRFSGTTGEGGERPRVSASKEEKDAWEKRKEKEFGVMQAGVLDYDFSCELLGEQFSTAPDFAARFAAASERIEWIKSLPFPAKERQDLKVHESLTLMGTKLGEFSRMRDRYRGLNRVVKNYDLSSNPEALRELYKRRGKDAVVSEISKNLEYFFFQLLDNKRDTLGFHVEKDVLRAHSAPLAEELVRDMKLNDILPAGTFLEIAEKKLNPYPVMSSSTEERHLFMAEMVKRQSGNTCLAGLSSNMTDVLRILGDRISDFRLERAVPNPYAEGTDVGLHLDRALAAQNAPVAPRHADVAGASGNIQAAGK